MKKSETEFAGWTHTETDGVQYQIQKERRLTCFGSPGYVMEWSVWRSFDTKDARDEAFEALQSHGSFEDHYRKHDYDPRMNRVLMR